MNHEIRVLGELGSEFERVVLASQRRRRFMGWRWRPLALFAVLALGGGTGALAAVGAFRTGSPVPASSDPATRLLVGANSELLTIRTPDPAGGPAWGVRVVRYNNDSGYGPAVCTQLGRIVDDKFGLLGEDGSFNDDGLFHIASAAAYGEAGCYGGTSGAKLSVNRLAGTGGNTEAVASGGAGENFGCSRVKAPARDSGSTSLVFRDSELILAARLRVLREGRAAAHAMARHYGASIAALISTNLAWLHTAQREANHETVTRWTYATCPAGSLRTIYYGYAGPAATAVTLTGNGVHKTVSVNPSEDGAFLFVLSGPPSRWAGEYRSVTCRGGRTYSHDWVCPRSPTS